MSTNKQAIIIGAGIAGLAAAIRLRRLGFEVLVFEGSEMAGGKIKEYRWGQFRFDTGPSLLTLPELIKELFTLCNKNSEDYLKFIKLPVVTKYFYDDGHQITSYADAEEFEKEAVRKVPIGAKTITDFLKQQEISYNLLAPVFIEKPIHIISQLFSWRNIPALFHLLKPYFLKRMDAVNQQIFKGESHLVKIFNRYGTYNGSNPYKMPSLFNIIAHLEHNKGAFLPANGMYGIVKALYQLAKEEGIEFKFNSYVESIIVQGNKAIGISCKGKPYYADVIVSNMDVTNTYRKLLATYDKPSYYLNHEQSTSAMIFHWAIDGRFPQLDVHNILFAENYKEEFEYLFDLKELYHDATVYIYISSKIVEGDAPVGNENWFVMINTPNLSAKKSDHWIETGRASIINKINKTLNIDIHRHILHENIISPQSLSDTTNAYLGSLYGASSNSMMSAFVRHPNFSSIEGLYFCGGTVHPGGGIPLCLLSAKITAELIAQKYTN